MFLVHISCELSTYIMCSAGWNRTYIYYILYDRTYISCVPQVGTGPTYHVFCRLGHVERSGAYNTPLRPGTTYIIYCRLEQKEMRILAEAKRREKADTKAAK